jgi:23S rRNA (adenine2503-C2)-methyltransferase
MTLATVNTTEFNACYNEGMSIMPVTQPTTNTINKTDLLGLTLPQLQQWLVERGEAPFRAKQLYSWLYKHLVTDFSAMTNLPQTLRNRLAQEASIGPMVVRSELYSKDDRTRKILLELGDGKLIESVLMLYPPVGQSSARARGTGRPASGRPQGSPLQVSPAGNVVAPLAGARATVCVSTQAGCAFGCTFCATGQMGFDRHLSAGEIVAQVLFFARQLRTAPWSAKGDREDHPSSHEMTSPSTGHGGGDPRGRPGTFGHLVGNASINHITNIVLMGMGEPLHNYDNVLQALRILNSADGFNLGARHMTVSTVGLVPAIRKLSQEPLQVNLAISLHAPTDELRGQTMPVNRKYPLKELLAACRDYIAATGRQITFEYVLLAGVNDTAECAHQLGALLAPLKQFAHVNCIPVNATSADYRPPSGEAIRAFRNILSEHHVSNSVRAERGDDIAAACGQLRTRFEKSVHKR